MKTQSVSSVKVQAKKRSLKLGHLVFACAIVASLLLISSAVFAQGKGLNNLTASPSFNVKSHQYYPSETDSHSMSTLEQRHMDMRSSGLHTVDSLGIAPQQCEAYELRQQGLN